MQILRFCLIISLLGLLGCGGSTISLHLVKPPMPIPGPRDAQAALNGKTGDPGIWEPNWSVANGIKYTLELEKKCKEDDILLDRYNQGL